MVNLNAKMKAPFLFLVIALWIRRISCEPRLSLRNEESVDKVENLIQYEYQYGVDEAHSQGPVMNRWEKRLGEYVKGAYSVMEPDGSIRIVDYEVDGDNGYHAIIRISPPAEKLLSIQQLTHSNELHPETTLSNAGTLSLDEKVPSAQTTNNVILNYHAKAPYINKPGFKDQRTAASNNVISKVVGEKLPLSPANFNVPQTKQPIYHQQPVTKNKNLKNVPFSKLYEEDLSSNKIDNFSHSSSSSSREVNALTEANTKLTSSRAFLPRINNYEKVTKSPKRNSRLVKRFNSMAEAYLV